MENDTPSLVSSRRGRRNSDLADLHCETAGYGFAFPGSLRGAGGNYDFADDTENGRIRLCIDAGPRRTLIEKMNGRSGRGVSRAAVPKNSRLVASGADPYEALSCFFRVIGEIAVPLAAAR